MRQQPFPEFVSRVLHERWSRDALPDSFRGGSAPCLEELKSQGIPFPALSNLLLSTANLGALFLMDITHSGYGYISPDNAHLPFRVGQP
jgi:hypothetical protein